MLRFPFVADPLSGNPPPSLPTGATSRWRPLVPVSIFGPQNKVRFFPDALLDTGADDSIFPMDVVRMIGVILLPTLGFTIRWRGQVHPLRFGNVELELEDASGAV